MGRVGRQKQWMPLIAEQIVNRQVYTYRRV
jgi:hypothetical protein